MEREAWSVKRLLRLTLYDLRYTMNDMHYTIHVSRGFTLLEVVLTSAALVIIFAVGILSYGSFNRTIDLDTVADIIAGQLRRAQTRAMNADDLLRWGVHFDNPTSGDDFYSLYSGNTYTTDVEKYFLPSGVVFTTPAGSATVDVSFEKLSGANVAGATQTIVIQTADGIQSKTISVNSVGRVSY